MYQVKKRNGELELFELSKVKSAIKRTFESCNRNYQDSIIETIAMRSIANAETKIKESVLSVEDIQDSVENILMGYGYEDVAKAYILYRKQHEKARNARETLLDYKKTVEKYTNNTDWRVKENSTVTYSLGGLILGNSGAVIANYWLSEIYDDEISNAHRNCDIHIHDLSMLSGYCAGWSLKQLIKDGLGGVQGKITSNPAKHLFTLCNQMVNFLGCFTDDTRIVLSDGTKPTIKEMLESGKQEWMVKSYDPKTNKIIDSKMDNLHKTRTVDEYMELEFDDGDIVKCTPDHKFYTYNRGWVEAKDLTEEDDVANIKTRKYIVYKVTNEDTGEFYIGSHITFNKNDSYIGSGRYIQDNKETTTFKKEILEEVFNREELRKREFYYINHYKNDPLCKNKVHSINRGFDNINENNSIFEDDTLLGFCVYKDNKARYVTDINSLVALQENGFLICGPSEIYNDGVIDYHVSEIMDTSGLHKGMREISLYKCSMLGKKHTEETRKKMKESQSTNAVVRGIHISQGINKVGEDGLTSAQRTQRRVGSDGLTHHQRIMKKQLESGNNNFIKNNPNYIICENGKSLPHNTNMKRVQEGTHNFLVTTNMGCHNKTLPKRIKQILEYFGMCMSWDVSVKTFESFCDTYPDWTGKFNYDGFLYTVRKAIERNNLTVTITGGVL
ncbi:MAG: hypothetical protein J6V44_15875 [Methanobrevibacter sp.]|nr:hypothetical protein [Methanobrevibacter sp.]MBO7692182.1 hypothetical protein [Methanobrevibacter sp.]